MEYTWKERSELTTEQQADLAAASAMRVEAHAPLSDYYVGAAIRMNDNSVFCGWNFEDIAGATMYHAEANAICRVTRNHRNGIKHVVVVGAKNGQESEEPISICGQCAQAIAELLETDDDPLVIMAGTRGKVKCAYFKEMYPALFNPTTLRDNH